MVCPSALGIAGAALFLIFPGIRYGLFLSPVPNWRRGWLSWKRPVCHLAYIIVALASLTWATGSICSLRWEKKPDGGSNVSILKNASVKQRAYHWRHHLGSVALADYDSCRYEYGTSYWGYPVTGPLLFCVITTAMGILLDYYYEKANSIWVPALGHGAINAFAGVPALFLNPAYSDQLLIGPLMIGVIGGLPLILSAIIISIKSLNQKEGQISPV